MKNKSKYRVRNWKEYNRSLVNRGNHTKICQNCTTFVLLPSLDLEICVKETVRRQIARPIGRSPEREEAVIRQR